jgi:hypothetical protein
MKKASENGKMWLPVEEFRRLVRAPADCQSNPQYQKKIEQLVKTLPPTPLDVGEKQPSLTSPLSAVAHPPAGGVRGQPCEIRRREEGDWCGAQAGRGPSAAVAGWGGWRWRRER